MANPILGNAPLVNAAECAGKVVVMERGGVPFVEKVFNAQNAGAIAVIMINKVDGPPLVMGGSSSIVTIPSAMISRADGLSLLNALSEGQVQAR